MHRRNFFTATAAAVLAAHGRAADPVRRASPFLDGNFGPVREEVAADELPVIGQLPPDLDGLFVRNGPNPRFDPLGNYHWFDGDGMLHGVRLRDGRASYRNRWVRTAGLEEEIAAGKALYPGIADAPDFQKLLSGKMPYKNTANTALIWHHDKLLAMVESSPPHEIRVPTLETVGLYDFNGNWNAPLTAHPKIDPDTGELVMFAYSPFSNPHVRYGVADKTGAVRHYAPIQLPRGVMMHDFAVTQTRTIFLDLPQVFDKARLFTGRNPFTFDPKYGARIGVMPRHGKADELRWFDIEPCFVFHTLNARDDGDTVELIACRMKRFPDAIQIGGAEAPGDTSANSAYLYRWRIDLASGKVSEGPLDDHGCEFPRVPDARVGKPARYGYVGREGGEFFDGVVKFDLQSGTKDQHGYGPGRFGGECVFVPKDGAKSEDDGYLLTYLYDRADSKSELLVIAANDLKSPPLARVKLPRRVPYGFHGTWIDGKNFS